MRKLTFMEALEELTIAEQSSFARCIVLSLRLPRTIDCSKRHSKKRDIWGSQIKVKGNEFRRVGVEVSL